MLSDVWNSSQYLDDNAGYPKLRSPYNELSNWTQAFVQRQ